MGMGRRVERCFITDAPAMNKDGSKDAIEYVAEYNGVRYFCEFDWMHSNSDKVNQNKHILKGLIINGAFPFDEENAHYSNKKLEKIIDEAIIPSTPKDKLDELILLIHSFQEFAGAPIVIYNKIHHDILLNKLYFRNHDEYFFYLSTLKELGYITFTNIRTEYGDDGTTLHITYQGLEYIIGLQEEGSQSKNCFIAMWFTESQSETRDAIKQVVTQCGYIPQLVDELHYDSEITINDAIIQHIKRSKFLIADFTGQRAGVYFESGYALGKGKPVIYMCSADDFKNRHFDTDHFPHIRYENLDDLKQMLEDKIKAWID